jgi:hypothetical protein
MGKETSPQAQGDAWADNCRPLERATSSTSLLVVPAVQPGLLLIKVMSVKFILNKQFRTVISAYRYYLSIKTSLQIISCILCQVMEMQ